MGHYKDPGMNQSNKNGMLGASWWFFTNPFELKYFPPSNWIIFSRFGVKIKTCHLKQPPVVRPHSIRNIPWECFFLPIHLHFNLYGKLLGQIYANSTECLERVGAQFLLCWLVVPHFQVVFLSLFLIVKQHLCDTWSGPGMARVYLVRNF